MFLTKPILTRREPLKRATPRIKLHIPLINLIKKDQVCYSAATSTTNQNATQRIYIKGIKWLGSPYRHTVLKCSMKLYLKWKVLFMLYLPSSKFSYCSNCSEDGVCSGYWYSSEGSKSTHDRTPKQVHNHIHTCKQEKTLRNSTTVHKNNEQNWARTILRVTTITWT